MSRKAEIGSNFWLSHQETGNLHPLTGSVTGLDKWTHCQLVSSGRGAIKLLFKNLPHVRKVLLPMYTCSSVINPIESLGIKCEFFPVRRDLTVNDQVLMDLVERTKADAVYLQSYYGFDTLAETRNCYQDLQAGNIIVIEDITHSWLSDFNSTACDYSIVSLRKWLQLPDGGALLSNKHPLGFQMTDNESDGIVEEFVKASEAKERYFQTFDSSDKEIFRGHYVNAKNMLQADDEPYRLSKMAQSVLALCNFEELIDRRKKNAIYLHENICSEVARLCCRFDISHSTPLYYPIYVEKERGELQKGLAVNNIYCPVHWPIPEQVKSILDADGAYIYSHILSLVCDQRYDCDDMRSVADVINTYK